MTPGNDRSDRIEDEADGGRSLPATGSDDRSAYPPGVETTVIPSLPPDERSRKRFVGVVSLVAAIGGALFGYDTGVISAALLFISHDFALDAVAEGLVTSILLVGAALGALGGGRLADRLGRRVALIAAGAVFIVASVGCALAPDVPLLLVSRFVLGVAVGIASIIVPLYIAEMAPPAIRGRLVSLNTLMIVTGQLAAYLVNAWLAQYEAWRWMLGIAAVPAIILVVGMLLLPDTPTWYQARGDEESALRVLRRALAEREAHRELRAIRTSREAQSKADEGWKALGRPWIRRALLIVVGIAILQQVTGVNTVIYFAPTLLVQAGLDSSTAVVSSISIGVISVLATWVGLRLVDRIPRKRLLIGGSILGAASLLALGATYPLTTLGTGWVFLTLGFMVLFLAFQQAAVATTTWLIISEMVPAAVRGIGMGVAGVFLWLTNWAVSLVFLPVVEAIGGGWTFAAFAAIGVVGVLFVWRAVPETGGKSLQQIERELRAAGGGDPAS